MKRCVRLERISKICYDYRNMKWSRGVDMLKKVKMSAKQVVYEELRDLIIEGKLKEGEKISDEEIAEKFCVSRTPVREALQLLETQKLVKLEKGRGTEVTKMETNNIEKWYLPMEALQRLAVEMAAKNAEKAAIDRLKKINQKFGDLVNGRAKPMDILGADHEFHKAIIDIADNEYIRDFCEVLWIHIQRLEYSFFKQSMSLGVSVEEHEDLIRALERKDEFSASMRMKEHWNRTVLEIYNLEHNKKQ